MIPISVVIPTRDRPESLKRCIRAVQRCILHPDDMPEIIVVDNNPPNGDTLRMVQKFFPEVVYVRCRQPGKSAASNMGLDVAKHEIVAFTDDDTEAAHGWLAAISEVFEDDDDAYSCVTGPVYAAPGFNEQQLLADQILAWKKDAFPATYALNIPQPDDPIFPFSPGRFGTGCNFAVRRQHVIDLGGFDESLGVGTPTKGGEDCDLFIRLVLAGRIIRYEPDALILHHHRSTADGLQRQIRSNAVGLGAYLTKIALDSSARPLAIKRAAAAVRRLREIDGRGGERVKAATHTSRLTTIAGLVEGSLAYLYARARLRTQLTYRARLPKMVVAEGLTSDV